MGPTPDPLEYAPFPGRLGHPLGYLLTRTGGVPHIGSPKSPSPPPPLPYRTHLLIHLPTGRAQPRRVTHLAQVENRGLSLGNFPPQGLERPAPPPRTPTCTGGGGREATGFPAEEAMGQDFFVNLQPRGEHPEFFWLQGLERPNPPVRLWARGGGLGRAHRPPSGGYSLRRNSQVKNRGELLSRFWPPGVVCPPAPSRAPACWDSLWTSPAPHRLEKRGVTPGNIWTASLTSNPP